MTTADTTGNHKQMDSPIKKIILIKPPIEDFYDTPVRQLPLGLGYLKSCISLFFPTIKIIIKDYHSDGIVRSPKKTSIPLPQELSYLKKFYPFHNQGPFSTFSHYYHFGASYNEIINDLVTEHRRSPIDIIGISSLFTAYYHEVVTITKLIKQQLSPSPWIVLGGPHPSSCPEEVIAENSIDFVIRGEGERPFVKLVATLSEAAPYNFNQIPNLVFKQHTHLSPPLSPPQIIFNPIEDNFPLDQIPYPDLSDLVSKLEDNKSITYPPISISMITSRGCIYKCRFCSIRSVFGDSYRQRAVEDVLAEIELRLQQGHSAINFEDDHLAANKHFFSSLLKGIIEHTNGNIPLSAMNGICYWHLDDSSLQLMKKAGFNSLNLALVTTNKSILEQQRRPGNKEKFIEVVRLAQQLKFEIVAYLILGLPNEDIDSTIETLVTLSELPLLIGASIFYSTPGMSLEELGVTSADYRLCRHTAMTHTTNPDHPPHSPFLLSREEIFTLFNLVRIINFIKGMELPRGHHRLHNQQRTQLGGELLQRLLHEGKLYGYNKNGAFLLEKFSSAVFQKFWSKIQFIKTQSGEFIDKELLCVIYKIHK
ncbi:MAG: B12-binding domain-containing radical SAM protein [Oligoflexia bacterium]|nr:B12-binding domain-containing radical SAM protein [Oligoflexia bacterium]